MPDKSHVSMERKLCMVCAKEYDTNALLLHRHLAQVLERYTVTGWGLCPDCEQKFREGYLALVAIDPEKSKIGPTRQRIDPGEAYRTGALVHIKRHVARDLFNVEIPDDLPMMFIDPEVVTYLEKLYAKTQGQSDDGSGGAAST